MPRKESPNNIVTTSINTDRLALQPVTPAFIHLMFETKSTDEIIAHFGSNESDFERYRSMHEKGMETNNISLSYFLLNKKPGLEPIGECGFHNWNRNHRRAELFYVLKSDGYKRLGYMTEALPHVLQFGFDQLGLYRIEALVSKKNMASVKLLHRFGFTFEGTNRQDYWVAGQPEDSDCYSLLKCDRM